MGSKFMTVAFMVLFVAFVFASWGFIINDFEKNYIDTNLTDAPPVNRTFVDGFDKSEQLNSSASGLTASFTSFSEGEDTGFAVFEAIVAIPTFIIQFPSVLFSMFTTASGLFVEGSKLIGIPPSIVLIGVISITLFLSFKLIEWWRRYDA